MPANSAKSKHLLDGMQPISLDLRKVIELRLATFIISIRVGSLSAYFHSNRMIKAITSRNAEGVDFFARSSCEVGLAGSLTGVPPRRSCPHARRSFRSWRQQAAAMCYYRSWRHSWLRFDPYWVPYQPS